MASQLDLAREYDRIKKRERTIRACPSEHTYRTIEETVRGCWPVTHAGGVPLFVWRARQQNRELTREELFGIPFIETLDRALKEASAFLLSAYHESDRAYAPTIVRLCTSSPESVRAFLTNLVTGLEQMPEYAGRKLVLLVDAPRAGRVNLDKSVPYSELRRTGQWRPVERTWLYVEHEYTDSVTDPSIDVVIEDAASPDTFVGFEHALLGAALPHLTEMREKYGEIHTLKEVARGTSSLDDQQKRTLFQSWMRHEQHSVNAYTTHLAAQKSGRESMVIHVTENLPSCLLPRLKMYAETQRVDTLTLVVP